jgi:adenosine deaminase
MGLSLEAIKRIIINGFKAAFLPFHVKQTLVRRINRELEAFHEDGSISTVKQPAPGHHEAPATEPRGKAPSAEQAQPAEAK